MLTHVDMVEVPGTSMPASTHSAAAQFSGLLAPMTAPVFEADAAGEQRVFSEVVAVTYRSTEGKPVHGGLFGFGADGVTRLALKDLDGHINTEENPAYVAFGLLMMRGPLVFRQRGQDQKMKISILDLDGGNLDKPYVSSPARDAVKTAYLTMVLPTVTGL